ncbi:MAG: hypothetical protein A2163_07925 [Actinobacteria bacterium RBG_13_35_12]|nr:MAG: hypothetical protein A2163_07925 [Actinobacteria bacterium RBG_13_35_12]
MDIIIKKNRGDREHDIKELNKTIYYSKDKWRRDEARKSVNKIKRESSAVKAMRESLIKAHRKGDTQQIRDIHDFIRNKDKYR